MTEEAARSVLSSRHGYIDDLAATSDVDGDDEARLDAMLRADTDLSEKALSTAASWSDYDGCTRLHLAAVEGRAEEASALIVLGAEPHHGNVDGDTPLDLAVQHGRDEVVHTLLRAGFNGYAPDGAPARTALHVAADYGQEGIVRILVTGGCKSGRGDAWRWRDSLDARGGSRCAPRSHTRIFPHTHTHEPAHASSPLLRMPQPPVG